MHHWQSFSWSTATVLLAVTAFAMTGCPTRIEVTPPADEPAAMAESAVVALEPQSVPGSSPSAVGDSPAADRPARQQSAASESDDERPAVKSLVTTAPPSAGSPGDDVEEPADPAAAEAIRIGIPPRPLIAAHVAPATASPPPAAGENLASDPPAFAAPVARPADPFRGDDPVAPGDASGKPTTHVVHKEVLNVAGVGATDTAYPKSKVDPVEANGPIFEGWQRPTLALLFTGQQNGYLEPCGCAGLENQKGGLKRRHTLIKELRSQGWPVLALDLGGQIKRFGTQSAIKLNRSLQALATLEYAAVGFGPHDLKLAEDLLSAAVNLETNPLVSANVALADFESGFTKRFIVAEVGGQRVGVTSILGGKYAQQVGASDLVEMIDAAKSLEEVIPQMKAQNVDLMVLLSHATPPESRKLAARFPQFDFVVTAGGAEEPPSRLERIEGQDTRLIEVGHKGMYVGVVGLTAANGGWDIAFQRVPLDARFEDSPEMQAMLTAYQQELQTVGLEGLVLRGSRKHKTGRTFVGSETCAECHTEAAAVFEATPHAHATETLVKLTPQRHFDPECLSCHVTGWDPQKYFPFDSGYLSLHATPEMVGNGCENCHGPGSAHVEAENSAVDDDTLERFRSQMRLKIEENEGNKDGQKFSSGSVVQMCVECHDTDNSPDFDFQEYWPHIEHVGKD